MPRKRKTQQDGQPTHPHRQESQSHPHHSRDPSYTKDDVIAYADDPDNPLDITTRKNLEALAEGMSREDPNLAPAELRALRRWIGMLKSDDVIAREEALRSILRLGRGVAPQLFSSLRDNDTTPEVQLTILDILGALGDPSLIEPLWNFYDETGNELVRSQIVLAIAVLGDDQASSAALELLASDDLRVIHNAILALVNTGDENAIPSLIDTYRRYLHPDTRENIIAAISSIAQRVGEEEVLTPLRESTDPIENELASLIEAELSGF